MMMYVTIIAAILVVVIGVSRARVCTCRIFVGRFILIMSRAKGVYIIRHIYIYIIFILIVIIILTTRSLEYKRL